MKRIIFTFSALSFLACALCAGAPKAASRAKGAASFEKYTMDNGYFSCLIPAAWTLDRDKDKDEEYKIFEIELTAPKSDKAPVAIFVSYYAKDNRDFNGYTDFISRNSTDLFGKTKSARDNYAPVKKIIFGGRKAFQLASERMEYLNPESKSDDSVLLKEKMYVLPAKDGFYVLRYNAPKTLFSEYLRVFEKVAKSFKGRP
jgi:hypothetical protein